MSNIFKPYTISKSFIPLIKEREMSIEHSINRFRASFLIVIASLDTISSFFVKELKYTSTYNIFSIVIATIAISFILFIHFTTQKGKRYREYVKYISVTLDLFITFGFAYLVLFLIEFPMPISKETFTVLITIILIFFNTLSVLRTDKRVVIYSGILTLFLNVVLFLKLYSDLERNVNMLVSYTSFFIIITSVFNIWVSNQIFKSFIINKKLKLANDVIIEKNSLIEQKNEELNQLLEEVTAQRDQISNQNREITDSIHYASRIQTALLPNTTSLESKFSSYFIIWKPLNIVSGDYYWIHQINEKTIVVVADCTGHGVPGAFMSMLGIAFLNEIIAHDKTLSSNEILNKLRKYVISALHQNMGESSSKDGMDISLIIFDHINLTAEFSGAYNPLYILRNNVLQQIKADKMPVGYHVKADVPFLKNEIQLKPKDKLYMFSDGYSDQFGGEKGRKFMTKRFRELITQTGQYSMSEQRAKLLETFESWKGDLSQIDDVTVLGIEL